MPIIEPEVDIHSPQKAEAEALLKAAILRQLDALAADQQVMLKLTLPEEDGFYAEPGRAPERRSGSWPSPVATAARRPTSGWPATPA